MLDMFLLPLDMSDITAFKVISACIISVYHSMDILAFQALMCFDMLDDTSWF